MDVSLEPRFKRFLGHCLNQCCIFIQTYSGKEGYLCFKGRFPRKNSGTNELFSNYLILDHMIAVLKPLNCGETKILSDFCVYIKALNLKVLNERQRK